MFFMSLLLILSPGLIAAFLYQRMQQQKIECTAFAILTTIFSFLVLFFNLVVLFLMGRTTFDLSCQSGSMLYSISFVVKYIGLSLIFATLLPYVLALLNFILTLLESIIQKSKKNGHGDYEK